MPPGPLTQSDGRGSRQSSFANTGPIRGPARSELGRRPIDVEILARRHPPIRIVQTPTFKRAGQERRVGVHHWRLPTVLRPGRLGQRRHVGAQDPRAPVNAQQSIAAIAQRIRCVLPHAADPQLRNDQRRVVLQPRYRPFRSSRDCREPVLDRIMAHVAIDAAQRPRLRQHTVEQRRFLGRPQDPAAGGQLEGRFDRGGRFLDRLKIGQRRVNVLPLHILPRPTLRRPEPVIVNRVRGHDPAEDALVHQLHGRGIVRRLPGRLQSLTHRLGNHQRRFGTHTRLDAELPRESKRVFQHIGKPVE